MNAFTHSRILSLLAALITVSIGCAKDPLPIEQVLRELDQHLGKQISIIAHIRSGARCDATVDGEFKTYCKDCVYCRGPVVLSPELSPKELADIEQALQNTNPGSSNTSPLEIYDWPIILAGTHNYQDIRCKGPLNQVECFPFTIGKKYIIEGVLTRERPPKLVVKNFRESATL